MALWAHVFHCRFYFALCDSISFGVCVCPLVRIFALLHTHTHQDDDDDDDDEKDTVVCCCWLRSKLDEEEDIEPIEMKMKIKCLNLISNGPYILIPMRTHRLQITGH